MKKLKKIQLMAILTGVLTFALVYLFLQNYQSVETEQKATREQIVVAAADIEPLTEITSKMLKLEEVPSEAVHPNAVPAADAQSVLGKISGTKIYAGEPILSVKISDPEDGMTGLAWSIEAGKRAITLNADMESGVGNMIQPGNKVDILTYYEIVAPEEVISRYEYLIRTYPEYFRLKSGKGGEKGDGAAPSFDELKDKTGVSTMLLQNVKVLAVDSIHSMDTYASLKPSVYAGVTLEVTPQQAVLVNAMKGQDNGRFRMVLRRQDDEEISAVERVKTEFNANFENWFEEGKNAEGDNN